MPASNRGLLISLADVPPALVQLEEGWAEMEVRRFSKPGALPVPAWRLQHHACLAGCTRSQDTSQHWAPCTSRVRTRAERTAPRASCRLLQLGR